MKKMLSVKMKSKWPCVYKLVNNFNFSNEMIAEVAVWVDVDKMSHNEAADKWIKQYEEKWKTWILQDCTA
ncbi:hypothetical protein H0A36_19975 [Endozoicomonas sp. SM1973]|uniref:ABC-type glycine betaine transport system substrate-binding domain-containing protein n=2 Tax=Spartinivicinus marinus TaxID=2994442 RepID=A0A853ICL9_9GAMM|nr:hypothetical protein [Spartinivicinus marinus]